MIIYKMAGGQIVKIICLINIGIFVKSLDRVCVQETFGPALDLLVLIVFALSYSLLYNCKSVFRMSSHQTWFRICISNKHIQ